MWEGPKRLCGFAENSCYKMWAGLNGFDPRTDFVLGGVRVGMDCINLVTVISEYTQVPVTLSSTFFGTMHTILFERGTSQSVKEVGEGQCIFRPTKITRTLK